MSDHRTHRTHSAIGADPERMQQTAELTREASIASGEQVRAEVAKLPDSANKTEFLRIQSEMSDFWQNQATTEFCLQWLMVAIKVQG